MSSKNNSISVAVAATVAVDDKTKVGENVCDHCKKVGHKKAACPLTPDSPRTKSIKYNLYDTGGFYQGKKYFKEDYQGQAEYLQDQIFKKEVSMTPEERQAHLEEIEYLDDDYMWSSFD